tara:strand:+ start:263 stop:688 length:426 start_codon:yes stop_codon:yes gene_type:complete
MIITKEIIEKIKESQEESIKEISNLESWSIKADEDLKEKWQALIDKLSNIKNSDEINILFLKLFSYLNTGDMIKFVMQLNKKDSDVFYGFIEEIENFKDKEKEELRELFKEKLMVLYRLNVIPKIFSEDRVSALRITLGKY